MRILPYKRKELRVRPLELREANAFIEKYHRHHKRVQGHRFSIGCYLGKKLLGCAVCGRPTSGLDGKRILEVTRLCSDGSRNVCSMLYSAAARAAQALGYDRVQTYIFESEHGSSLKASGWKFERKAHPSGRHRNRSDGKPRDTAYVAIPKTLWAKDFGNELDFDHHRRIYK